MKGLFLGAILGVPMVLGQFAGSLPPEVGKPGVIAPAPAQGPVMMLISWWDLSCYFTGPNVPWCPMKVKDPVIPFDPKPEVTPNWCEDVYGPCLYPEPVTR